MYFTTEGLRQEAGDNLQVTIISPGFLHIDFADAITNETVKAQIIEAEDKMDIPPDAIAREIPFAIDQQDNVDLGEIVVWFIALG